MSQLPTRELTIRVLVLLTVTAALLATLCAPDLALAQASPFMTGASSLQTNILAWLTPVAIILIMVLGGMAMANRLLRIFARRRRRDVRSISAAAGIAEGGRCALFAQVRRAGTPTDRTGLLARRLFLLR